jgi:ligand-binding sensor domain-containing protein
VVASNQQEAETMTLYRTRLLTLLVFAMVSGSHDVGASRVGDKAPHETLLPGRPASSEPDTSAQIGKDIHCIFQDKAGSFWFGTDGEGVCRYDGWSFTDYTEKDGLCSNFVRNIAEDQNGTIWFGTRDGICRFEGNAFTTLAERDIHRSTGGPARRSQGEPGILWFAARDGAYRLDGKSCSYVALSQADVDVRFRQDHPEINRAPYAVYSVLEDRSGIAWFGTEQRGVCRYDGTTFTYLTAQGLNNAAVRCIFQDQTGCLWFGSNGAGVCRYDGRTLTNFTEQKGLGNAEFPTTLVGRPGTLARVWTVAEDRAGNLWFGTIHSGAWRYDGRDLVNFTVEDGLTSNANWTIYKDRAGDLWFGTCGGGVCKYDGRTFINVTRKAVGRS